MTLTFPRGLSLLALACLTTATRADSKPSPIRDDAGLFHTEAIARAEERIADIHRSFDRRLFVRTVESALPKQQRLFAFLSKREANRLLEEQARHFADEVGINGIHIAICKHPRDVHVIVRPGDDPQFTHRDAEALRRLLAHRLADSSADSALLALVDEAQSLLQAHAEGGSSSLAHEILLVGVLGGGLALWFLLGMIRFRMRRRQAATIESRSGEPSRTDGAARLAAPTPHDQDTAMQARATPALLGALFGFPAGMWIYDKLYPCPAGTPLPLCEPRPQPEDESLERTAAEEHPHEEHTEGAPVSP